MVLHQALHVLEEHDQFLEVHREEIRAKIEKARQSPDRGEGVDSAEVFDRLFKELPTARRLLGCTAFWRSAIRPNLSASRCAAACS